MSTISQTHLRTDATVDELTSSEAADIVHTLATPDENGVRRFSRLPYNVRRQLLSIGAADISFSELYGDDPLGFGYDVLDERYTEDVARLIETSVASAVVVARSATAVGKTHACGALITWWALCKPAAQVWFTAAPPESNLTNLLWPQIERRYHKHRYLFDAAGWQMKHLALKRSWREYDGEEGSEAEAPVVVGVRIPTSGTPKQKEAKFSGKHARNLLFVVDEGDAVPDEVYLGIDGCMSGGHARLIVLFNPREQAGPVWNMERDGRAAVVELSALRHPNVVSGQDVIPGAVSREITVRRIIEWTEPAEYDDGDPALFRVPDWLVAEQVKGTGGVPYDPLAAGLRRIRDPQFAYKVLGIYPPVQSVDQVFDVAFLNRLRRKLATRMPLRKIHAGEGIAGECLIFEEPRPHAQYVLGADTAEGRHPSRGDFCCFDIIDVVRHVQVAHYSARVDPHTYAGDIVALASYYNNALVAVELNNHGHAVVEALKHTHQYLNLYYDRQGRPGIASSARTKAAYINNLAGTLSEMKIGASDGLDIRCMESIDQMLTFARLPGGTMGGKHGTFDDAVTALALAWYVACERSGIDPEKFEPAPPMVLYG